jgi:hypothetical protein
VSHPRYGACVGQALGSEFRIAHGLAKLVAVEAHGVERTAGSVEDEDARA